MANRNDGSTALFIGVSRSGKSVPVKRAIENDKRVIVFDPKGECSSQLGFARCLSRDDLVKMVQEVGAGDAQIEFMANSKADFDFFCGVAFIFNMYKPCTIVCEELARVTSVNKAEGNWGRLVSQGLAYGPRIFATVQRGQEADKSILNNCSFVHVCRHNTESDRQYIAEKLGVPVEKIPTEKLEFIQWTSDRGLVVEGNIDFPVSKKTKKWPNGAPRFREKGGNRRVITIGPGGMFKQVQYQ